jgi:4-amino-4-deoxy-L-arabinose transferase-like glycosyltransferase
MAGESLGVRRAVLQPIRADEGARVVRPLRLGLGLLGVAVIGALLVLLAYQVPARQHVDIGGRDGAYVQGFHDAERADAPAAPSYLAGADGRARWTRAESYLVFPQIGQPAELRLRLRGWPASSGATTELQIRNNRVELARVAVGPEWQEVVVPLRGELFKPQDTLIVLRATTTSLPDGREVGVLLDRAELATSAWPLRPYPAQLVYGALAAVLFVVGLGLGPSRPRSLAPLLLGGAALALAFLLLYRLAVLGPYPLHKLLPGACALLALLVAVRAAALPQLRGLARPAVADVLALALVGAWLIGLLLVAQQHVTLSVPGVEKDFRVFATRTHSLDAIFRADGFYNLGYPLLLALVQPLTAGNSFLAARLLAALFAALLLGASYLLARPLLGAWWALVAALLLGLSAFVVQYGLTIGSDMPFAALVTLCLALLVWGPSNTQAAAGGRGRGALYVGAGLMAGAAFLVRHPGLLLLPFGLLAIGLSYPARQRREALGPVAFFLGGFLLAAAPQLVVNTLQAGSPLYSQQAKNIWLGVYGNTDWDNWQLAPNTISLADVLLSDPARFLANWTGNLRAYLGTGAEDTSEFGRAVQLRMLGFPANWLAIAGLFGIAWAGSLHTRLLLGWVALYATAISVGFLLARFVLPLAPIYALAAACCLKTIVPRIAPGKRFRHELLAALGLALLLVLLPNVHIAARQVLDQQPADQVAAVALVRQTRAPHERLLAQLPPDNPLADYSAIAHLIVEQPAEAAYLLSDTAPPAGLVARLVGQAGPYQLYRIEP